MVGWLDHLALVLPGQDLLGESQPALTPTLRQGNNGKNRCTTINNHLSQIWNYWGFTFPLIFVVLPQQLWKWWWCQPFSPTICPVSDLLSFSFSFGQIAPGWNHVKAKHKPLAYSKVYDIIRSMYHQQVDPEHGYTTYIMRSLRSPPAQKVPTQLGKLEIKIWKLLKSHISVIMQELQDGWSPKDLTSAVSSLCQFCTHTTIVRNTNILMGYRSQMNL